jgi:hypothetical protein
MRPIESLVLWALARIRRDDGARLDCATAFLDCEAFCAEHALPTPSRRLIATTLRPLVGPSRVVRSGATARRAWTGVTIG